MVYVRQDAPQTGLKYLHPPISKVKDGGHRRTWTWTSRSTRRDGKGLGLLALLAKQAMTPPIVNPAFRSYS